MSADAERYRALFEGKLAALGVEFDAGGLETEPTPAIRSMLDAAAHEKHRDMWAVHTFYWRQGVANKRVALPNARVLAVLASRTSPVVFLDALVMGMELQYYEDTPMTYRYVTSLLAFMNEHDWFNTGFNTNGEWVRLSETAPSEAFHVIDNVSRNIQARYAHVVDNFDVMAALIFACLFELYDDVHDAGAAAVAFDSFVACLDSLNADGGTLHILFRFEGDAQQAPTSVQRFLARFLESLTRDRQHDFGTCARFVKVMIKIIDRVPAEKRAHAIEFLRRLFFSGGPCDQQAKDILDGYLTRFGVPRDPHPDHAQLDGGGAGLRDNSPPIVAMVSRLQAELVKCRMAAMAGNDAYTYRHTKVAILTHVRRNIESTLRYKDKVEGKTVDRCIQLHNSPRHMFTLSTWKEIFPTLEKFIRSDDPSKRAMQPLIQSRMQLYALFELANMLETAQKAAGALLTTLQSASRDDTMSSSAAAASTCFRHLDALIWLQQKTWREHAFDDFYTLEQMQQTGCSTLSWFVQHHNLFARINKLPEYSPFLSTLLQERTTDYDRRVEAAIVKADVNFPYNGDARDVADADPDLFNPCASTQSDVTTTTTTTNDNRNRSRPPSPRGTNDIVDRLFNDLIGEGQNGADDAFLQSFLDEMAEQNAGVDATALPHRGGGAYYTDADVKSKLPTTQRKVSILVDELKKTLMECTSTINMIKMTSTWSDGADAWSVLQSNIQRVGDAFYHRIRLGPNHYFRAFGADSKLVAGRKPLLENPFERRDRASFTRASTLLFLTYSLTEIDALLIFLLKFSRVATLLLAIYVAQHVFLERYVHDVYTSDRVPPSLFNVMLFALSIDACLQLVLITFIVIASVLLKTPSNSFVLDDTFLTLLLKEYVLSTILMIILGSIVAWIMGKKRYFGYRSDGIRVIKAYSATLLGVLLAVAAIPCFRLFA